MDRTKLEILKQIRERYIYLINEESNASRKELYIRWKQETEHLIDVITEEKFVMDKQNQENEREELNYKKGV